MGSCRQFFTSWRLHLEDWKIGNGSIPDPKMMSYV